ncbi:MAG: hypothetical protein K1X94_21585 [Sandaracinaceae bacterium]|nr:hypothetical protein [Sandaracinaceae bacterium]
MAASTARTAPSRRRARRSQDITAPALPALRAILVAGSRASELAAIARAFDGHSVTVVLAKTREEALAELRRRHWACALVDARWEIELADEVLGCADSVSFFVTDPKRARGRYRPLPLGQADVAELLGPEGVA